MLDDLAVTDSAAYAEMAKAGAEAMVSILRFEVGEYGRGICVWAHCSVGCQMKNALDVAQLGSKNTHSQYLWAFKFGETIFTTGPPQAHEPNSAKQMLLSASRLVGISPRYRLLSAACNLIIV